MKNSVIMIEERSSIIAGSNAPSLAIGSLLKDMAQHGGVLDLGDKKSKTITLTKFIRQSANMDIDQLLICFDFESDNISLGKIDSSISGFATVKDIAKNFLGLRDKDLGALRGVPMVVLPRTKGIVHEFIEDLHEHHHLENLINGYGHGSELHILDLYNKLGMFVVAIPLNKHKNTNLSHRIPREKSYKEVDHNTVNNREELLDFTKNIDNEEFYHGKDEDKVLASFSVKDACHTPPKVKQATELKWYHRLLNFFRTPI